jgi:hypothetical protein
MSKKKEISQKYLRIMKTRSYDVQRKTSLCLETFNRLVPGEAAERMRALIAEAQI